MTTVDGAELDVSVTDPGGSVGGVTRVHVHGMLSSRAHERASGLDLGLPGRAIAYDARGHGRSTGRSEPADYHWPRLAEDLLAVLDEHAEGPVDGVGASMGTATLLIAALRDPGRFRRLVLTIPPTAWETRAAQGEVYRQMADVIEAGGIAALADLMAAPAAPQPPPAMAGHEMPLPDVAESLLPPLLRGAAATDLPDPDRLRDLELPVLLLPWTGDPGHPMSTSEALLDVLPDARMHVVATPADLADRPRLVADFLGSA